MGTQKPETFVFAQEICCFPKAAPCFPLSAIRLAFSPLRRHTKQTIAPSKRLKSRMHDSARLLQWLLLSPWGFPHQSQHNRNSQLLYVCWPLDVGFDLVADTENSRRSYFQDRCCFILACVFQWLLMLRYFIVATKARQCAVVYGLLTSRTAFFDHLSYVMTHFHSINQSG